jgi:hypothetical protein
MCKLWATPVVFVQFHHCLSLFQISHIPFSFWWTIRWMGVIPRTVRPGDIPVDRKTWVHFVSFQLLLSKPHKRLGKPEVKPKFFPPLEFTRFRCQNVLPLTRGYTNWYYSAALGLRPVLSFIILSCSNSTFWHWNPVALQLVFRCVKHEENRCLNHIYVIINCIKFWVASHFGTVTDSFRFGPQPMFNLSVSAQ